MKKRYLILFALLPSLLFADTLQGLVIRVADGDTITVLDAQKQQHRVRLNHIDAPESHQDFGKRSSQFMSDLVYRKNVRVEYKEKDRYGRILGEVYIGNTYANLAIVKAGLAWHYVYFSPNNKEMAAAEKEARTKKLGLWSQPNPIPPWDFRRLKKQTSKQKN